MKKFERFLAVLLAAIMVLSLCNGFTVLAAVYSGTCGKAFDEDLTLTWEFDEDTGTLTISGNGEMYDYSSYRYTPWYGLEVVRVVINSGVTSIGNYAFGYRQNLTDITIPDSVTSIGSDAFCYCSSLADITIPDSVTSIGTRAFYYCSSLTSITIPDSVTSIGDVVFYGCSNLTSITLPDSITSIGLSFFNQCKSLTSITIPDSVTSIGSNAFKSCYSLTSITIPDSVTSIGGLAFYGCSSLSDVYYSGSEDDWAEIEIGSNNDCLTSATIHYNSTGPESGGTDDEESTGTDTESDSEDSDWTDDSTVYVITEPDTWSFSNSKGDFNIISYSWSWSDLWWEEVNNGYYITSEDYERFISNLDATEAIKFLWTEKAATKSGYSVFADVYDELNSLFNVDGYDIDEYLDWGGSCEGMSTWVCLTAAGVLSASDIDGSTSLLSDYECSDEVQSAINYYHMQQWLSACQNLAAEFMNHDQEYQLDTLKELAAAASSGGNLLRIGFGWYEIENGEPALDDDGEYVEYGHCIVGYGLEYGDYTDYVYGILGDRIGDSEYTCRILTYDPSNSGEEYYIYISDDGHWCIPGYEIISSSNKMEEWDDAEDNNGKFHLITSSTDEINLIDYNTGELSSLESEAASFNGLVSLSGSSYSVSGDGYSADINGAIVSNNTGDEDIYVIINSGITSDGESTGTTFTAVLPDSASCTVTTDEAAAFYLDTGNYLTLAALSSEGSITFDSAGGASVSAQEDSTLYISITADDGYTDLAWNTVEIAAESTSGLSAALAEEGLVVSGEDLSNILIYAVADDEDDDTGIFFTTEEESAVITSTDSGEIQVLTDTDGDGEYETEIEYEMLTASMSDAVVTLESSSFTYTGSAIEPSVTVTLGGTELTAGTDYTVSYSDNIETGTATVTVTGMGSYSGTVSAQFEIICSHNYTSSVTTAATCTEVGVMTYICAICGETYTETIAAAGHSYSGTNICTVCGTLKSSKISDAEITLPKTSYTYNGSARKPSVTVVINGTTLTKNTDYTVSYSDNTNAGTATVTIKGKGSYSGTKTVKFTIKAKSINSATVTLSCTSYTYNGKVKKPSVKSVKVSGTTLSSSDYTVKYASGRKSIGTYNVKVTGTGNYTGTATVTFTIKPGTVKISSAASSAAKKLTVKWNKVSGSVTGYQVRYKKSTSSSWTTVTVKASTLSKTISSLTAGKKYSVQVRAYKTVSGKKYYGSWSSTKSVTVKKAQTLTVKSSSSKTVSYSKVKKAKQTVSVITKVSGAKGTVTYSKSSGKSYFTVNSKTGKVTVKKGTPKGTYTVKIKVTSAAKGTYAAASKTVTVKIKVK